MTSDPRAHFLEPHPQGWPAQMTELGRKASLPLGLPAFHFNTFCFLGECTMNSLCPHWPFRLESPLSVTHLSLSTKRLTRKPCPLSLPKISVPVLQVLLLITLQIHFLGVTDQHEITFLFPPVFNLPLFKHLFYCYDSHHTVLH